MYITKIQLTCGIFHKIPLESVTLDCEQSLSFPRVARVAICEGRARAARSAGASPHSLLVSFPNLHNINSSAPRISGTKTDYS